MNREQFDKFDFHSFRNYEERAIDWLAVTGAPAGTVAAFIGEDEADPVVWEPVQFYAVGHRWVRYCETEAFVYEGLHFEPITGTRVNTQLHADDRMVTADETFLGIADSAEEAEEIYREAALLGMRVA